MAERRFVLAADIGNSKADVAVFDRHDASCRWVRGGNLTPGILGWDGCARAILELAELAEPRAEGAFASGYFAVAGVDFPDEEAHLYGALARQAGFGELTVVNDAFAVLGSAGSAEVGVCVIVGAGTNCVAVHDGTTIRFPALGEISGDWGGGRDLGLAALAAACRSEDGRGPSTTLQHSVPAHFAVARPLDVTLKLHHGELELRHLIPLAELVFREARGGDQEARRIVHRQADEVARFLTATHHRLAVVFGTIPVVLGGSVLRHGGAVLYDRIRESVNCPGLELVIPVEPPIFGSLVGALELLGAPGPGHAVRRALPGDPVLIA